MANTVHQSASPCIICVILRSASLCIICVILRNKEAHLIFERILASWTSGGYLLTSRTESMHKPAKETVQRRKFSIIGGWYTYKWDVSSWSFQMVDDDRSIWKGKNKKGRQRQSHLQHWSRQGCNAYFSSPTLLTIPCLLKYLGNVF